MKQGKTYKTTDNAVWFCIGHIKKTPAAVSWTGNIYKLSRRYGQNAVECDWQEWYKRHRYFWLNCVVGGSIDRCQDSVNKILKMKI